MLTHPFLPGGSARRSYLAVNAASLSTFLPYRRPSPSPPRSPRAFNSSSPSSSRLASPRRCLSFVRTRCSAARAISHGLWGLSRSPPATVSISLRSLRGEIVPPFSPEQTALRHYINALIGVVAARFETLGDEDSRASERASEKEKEIERERKRREGEPRITGIICPPARATISPDPPAISRSSSASTSRSFPRPPRPSPSHRRTSFTTGPDNDDKMFDKLPHRSSG